jgi:hypothetical protein
LYRLNKKQRSIIGLHCCAFKDVKYLAAHELPFMLNNKEFNVVQGFVCDGVSAGSNLIAVDTAIEHDFLYATHPDTKRVCDSVLKPCYRKYAVAVFGNSAWNTSGQRGALVVTQKPSGITVFTIYHTADYSVIGHEICLPENESREFDPFFEVARTCT